jgi:phosphoribosylformylglycinamidine synthase subunit PurL
MRIKGSGHGAIVGTAGAEAVIDGVIGFAPFGLAQTGQIAAATPERGIAMALAGNGRWCYLDPKLGAMHAVAEAARKVACTGATPVAATNCLNFGNPEKPEIMAQLSAAIDGIAEACTALGTPVTGGNVSLYNETKGEGIYPTPVIGIVGLLDDVSKAVPSGFQRAGQTVALLVAPTKPHAKIESNADAQRAVDTFASNTLQRMGSSEFAKTILGSIWGTPPHLHIEGNASLHRFLIDLADRGLLTAAKDVSDGGVAIALAQMAFDHGVGATVNKGGLDAVSGLFEEDASEVVVTFETDQLEQIRRLAQPFGVWVNQIGETGGDHLKISVNSELVIDQPIRVLHASFTSTLESQLAAEVVTA